MDHSAVLQELMRTDRNGGGMLLIQSSWSEINVICEISVGHDSDFRPQFEENKKISVDYSKHTPYSKCTPCSLAYAMRKPAMLLRFWEGFDQKMTAT